MNIILFGGTFDPVHQGHMKMAAYANDYIDDSKVIFVPNNQNPLKEKPPFFSNTKRLDKLSEELVNYPAFGIDTRQIFSNNKSYTIDLINMYQRELLFKNNLYYLIGSDALNDFNKYKDWEKILDKAKVLVFSRSKNCVNKIMNDKFKGYENRIELINSKFDEINISSTKIRNKLKGKINV